MDGNSDDDVTFEDPDWVDKILARAVESAEGDSDAPTSPSDGDAVGTTTPADATSDAPPDLTASRPEPTGDLTGSPGPPRSRPPAEPRDTAPPRPPAEPRDTAAPRPPAEPRDTAPPRPPAEPRDAAAPRHREREPVARAPRDDTSAPPAAHSTDAVDPDELPWSSQADSPPSVDQPTEAHDGWFADDDWEGDDWSTSDNDGDTELPDNLGRGPSADEVIASWVNEDDLTGDVLVDSATDTDGGPAAPAAPKSTARTVAEWGAVIVGALLVAFLVKSFLVQAFYIPSESMVPTLNEGDRVLVNKLSYDLGDVSRGDVIVFERPENETGSIPDLIKRAIAFGGETITFRDGEVFIDDQLLIEPYLAEESSTDPFRTIPNCENEATDSCVIPDDFVFVMGDNRRDSRDSRFFGPIDQDSIVGRAFLKIWPLSDIGGL